MEPSIQYAQTTDGVSIAFWTLGEGMPLVQMLPFTHIQGELRIPELRRFFDSIAQNRIDLFITDLLIRNTRPRAPGSTHKRLQDTIFRGTRRTLSCGTLFFVSGRGYRNDSEDDSRKRPL